MPVATPVDDPETRGAHTARRARPAPGQPIGVGSRVIQYRPLAKCHKRSAMLVARGEPVSFWCPQSPLEYIDLVDHPDECYFCAHHENGKYHQHEEQVQLQTHKMQRDIANFLWITMDDVYKTADIAQFKSDVLELAFVAKKIADRRFINYHKCRRKAPTFDRVCLSSRPIRFSRMVCLSW